MESNRWWWSHPWTISRFDIFLWDTRTMSTYVAKIWETLAMHFSQHRKDIREDEQFWLEEHRKSVRGNDKVPSHEERHKLAASSKTLQCSTGYAEPGTSRICMLAVPISICQSRKAMSTKLRFTPSMQFEYRTMPFRLMIVLPIVSNCTRPSLRVQVQVQTKPVPNWRSRPWINPNCSPRYGSMVNSQPVWIGRAVSASPTGHIYRFI